MKIVLAAIGFGIFIFCFDSALDVEEAFVDVCRGQNCPLIAGEIHLLKACAIVTAVAIPAGIGWFVRRIGNSR